jgi:hypothetical protein
LIEDEELRFRLATNAQNTIRENWLLSQNAYRWENAYKEAFEIASSKRKLRQPFTNFLESINSQLADVFIKKEANERMIAEQKIALESYEEEVHQLNTEILGYVLSRSWRITRPFRILGRKIKTITRKNHV